MDPHAHKYHRDQDAAGSAVARGPATVRRINNTWPPHPPVLPEHPFLHQAHVQLVLPLPLHEAQELRPAAISRVAGDTRGAHGEVPPDCNRFCMAAHLHTRLRAQQAQGTCSSIMAAHVHVMGCRLCTHSTKDLANKGNALKRSIPNHDSSSRSRACRHIMLNTTTKPTHL